MKTWQLIAVCLALVAIGIGLVMYLTPKEQLEKDFDFYNHTPVPNVDEPGLSRDEWCAENPKLCKG